MTILKHLLYLIALLFLVASCKSTSSATSSSKKTSRLNEQIIDDATDKIGSPYKYGGTTNAGYDCSGLVFTSFQKTTFHFQEHLLKCLKKGQSLKKMIAEKAI